MESGEKDYWEQQAELPLHRRSRGWWIEVGAPSVAMIVVPIAVIVGLIVFLVI